MMRRAGRPRLLLAGILLTLAVVALVGVSVAKSGRESPHQVEGAVWIPASPMTEPRSGHTATPLRDGRILVAGGVIGRETLSSAELYDPSTDTWAGAGSLQTPRAGHTATLLADGMVLVTGGARPYTADQAMTSAEMYDPATGAWTAAGLMQQARSGHTATLLPDGSVLVLGGSRDGIAVERFLPATGTWVAAASMSVPRLGHAAALLPDGKVLVTGGIDTGDTGQLKDARQHRTAEVYDPVADAWLPANSMAVPRFEHTATPLLDGRVLVAGGAYLDAPANADGGRIAQLASAELYDPASGTWTLTDRVSRGRAGHTATLTPDGYVLVVGGENGYGDACPEPGASRDCSTEPREPQAYAELYDPRAGTWTGTGPMQRTVLGGHAAVRMGDGNILVVGGAIVNDDTMTADEAGAVGAIYASGGLPLHIGATPILPGAVAGQSYAHTLEVAGGSPPYTWAALPGMMPDGGALPDGVTLDPLTGVLSGTPPRPGRFTFVARVGDSAGATRTRTFLLRSVPPPGPRTPSWTPTGPMVVEREGHTATLLANGAVLVVGGGSPSERGRADRSSAELYDPATNTWTPTGRMHVGRSQHTATLLPDGKVLVVGGYDPGGIETASAELYDPDTGTWTVTGSMSVPRVWHAATLLGDGTVLVVGTARTALAEVYDPAAGAWNPAGEMSAVRFEPAAVLLSDGRVLAAGGRGVDNMAARVAELYDPAARSWTMTGSLTSDRMGNTATLLPDGTVLLIQGPTREGGSVERYDPGTGTWTADRGLTRSLYYHTVTLLPDGTVLVTGSNAGRLGSRLADQYDPATRTWFPAPAMSAPRRLHTATLLPNGRVLVAGGAGGAELYDPATGE